MRQLKLQQGVAFDEDGRIVVEEGGRGGGGGADVISGGKIVHQDEVRIVNAKRRYNDDQEERDKDGGQHRRQEYHTKKKGDTRKFETEQTFDSEVLALQNDQGLLNRKVANTDYKITLRFLTKSSKGGDQQLLRSELTKYFRASGAAGTGE